MSGVTAGLIGSLKKATSSPVNLVSNGSATTSDATGWSVFGRNLSTFKTSPAAWNANYDLDIGYFMDYTKAGALTSGQAYSFSAWVYSPVTTVNVYMSAFSGFTSENFTVTPNTWTYIKKENLTANGTGLYIYFTDSQITDDVAVVAGPTAI